MDIKSVLDERIICTELDAVDKEDALKKMIKMLLDAGYIDDAEGFYEDVLLRKPGNYGHWELYRNSTWQEQFCI